MLWKKHSERDSDIGRAFARLASLSSAVILTAILAPFGSAATQTYPSRPITIIVPYAAGGPSDTLLRILAERMQASLGQAVIIDNVGGAAGRIGTGRGARAVGAILARGRRDEGDGSGVDIPGGRRRHARAHRARLGRPAGEDGRRARGFDGDRAGVRARHREPNPGRPGGLGGTVRCVTG